MPADPAQPPRRRGRPPQYDRATALEAAIALFSQHGYSGTSIDALADAMGMTKPSVYNAFGDKQAVYRLALEHFVDGMNAALGEALERDAPLADALTAFYLGAIEVYFSLQPARGCFVFCTAPVEALEYPHVGTLVAGVLETLDRRLAARFARAIAAGELDRACDENACAKSAQAILHSLAIRARAGESRRSLERFARHAARLLAGATA